MGLGSALFAASERCVPNPLARLLRGLIAAVAALGISSWLGLGLPWLLLTATLAGVLAMAAGGSGWSSSAGAYHGIRGSPHHVDGSFGGGASGRW
jgi:hypothetical protein